MKTYEQMNDKEKVILLESINQNWIEDYYRIKQERDELFKRIRMMGCIPEDCNYVDEKNIELLELEKKYDKLLELNEQLIERIKELSKPIGHYGSGIVTDGGH